MTSSGTRTPARSTYDAWSSLDPDLLVIVAKNCDATSVCRLSQACKAWRGAVAANSSSIWEQLVSKRFPRSVDILKALPPMPKYSFAEHYREQLKAESSSTEPKALSATTQLSDFIFTAELVSASEPRRIVDAWTGNVNGLALRDAEGDGNFVLPIDWSPWSRAFSTANTMQLELFVSRAFNGRVRTRKLYVSETEPDDGERYGDRESYWFYNAQSRPPVKGHYVEQYFRHDEPGIYPVVHLDLFHPDDKEPAVWVQFRLDTEYNSHGMTATELLEYLEHGVDWE